MSRSAIKILLLFMFFPMLKHGAFAVVPLKADRFNKEHFFVFNEFEYLEDPGGKLSFNEVLSPLYQGKFIENKLNYPVNEHRSSYYWFKVSVDYSAAGREDYTLAFFNHGITDLQVFLPDTKGRYQQYRTGAKYPFGKRAIPHKNFNFKLDPQQGIVNYYFRLKADNAMNLVVLHSTLNRFITYSLTEYILFGLFYGFILVLAFYNLMMYVVMKERHYLYYLMYLLAVGLYEVSNDGIAFQYLWPDAPVWNTYAFGTWSFLISIFALLFTKELLQVKNLAPVLNTLLNTIIAVRFIFYLICVLFKPIWFNYSIIELAPLLSAFFTGIYVWRKGFKAARFFVMAYAFLFAGFLAKLLVSLGFGWFIPGPLPHYSMSLGFICEMIFLSLAIGDKVRILKQSKEESQQFIIFQMEENAKLKDTVNSQLEIKVEQRTKVILEKSEEIIAQTKEIKEKSLLIEAQNEELLHANLLLKEQAEEIFRMNTLLEKDNEQLHTDIKKVTHSRLMSAEVSFEEFSTAYPDRDAAFRFLADLKWASGYQCKKCASEQYWIGTLPHSRKCSNCKYDESVLVGTVLQNTRIPLNKALYTIFLIYSAKGKISSHKLSQLLDIRQNTCLVYSNKIKKLMEERKKILKDAGEDGWSKLLME